MAKLVCRKVGYFSRRRFSLNLGGRTMEFDKVNEPEQNDQSSAIPSFSGCGYDAHGSRVYKVL